MPRELVCQYNGCMEPIAANGIVVTLKTETYDGEKRAVFCCASHAAASLQKLAMNRLEKPVELPFFFKTR